MGLTQGLWDEFGAKRVIDTPISETAIMGAAAGAALSGLRPIAELMFSDFFGVCFDQIYNQAAKFRFMYGDQGATPLVIRTMIGAGIGCGPQHSQSPYSIFALGLLYEISLELQGDIPQNPRSQLSLEQYN